MDMGTEHERDSNDANFQIRYRRICPSNDLCATKCLYTLGVKPLGVEALVRGQECNLWTTGVTMNLFLVLDLIRRRCRMVNLVAISLFCAFLGGCLPTPNSSAAKDGSVVPAKRFVMKSGMVLVEIPAGKFRMGHEKEISRGLVKNEISISKFYLGAYEVTNAQFDAFRKKKRLPASPSDNHPVVMLTRKEVYEFLDYLSKKDGIEYFLPSEAQWEYAARDGKNGLDFPWGNDVDESKFLCGGLVAKPVGSYPPTNWGLYDIIGNVAEATGDSANDQKSVADKDPVFHDSSEIYVVKGIGIGATLPHLWLRFEGVAHIPVDGEGFRVATYSITPKDRK